jgi:uncharacterized protein YgiM (DUF1202 family)
MVYYLALEDFCFMRLKLLICLMLTALLLPLAAWAQDSGSTGIIVTPTSNLRIRAQPTQSAPSLQVVPRGTVLSALGRSSDNSWIQVEYKGVIGWASVIYLATSDDLTRLPVTDASLLGTPRPEERVSAPDGTIVNTGELVVYSSQSNINVRVLPEEGSAVLGQLAQFERATVTLLDPSRTWGRIEFQGQPGWVALYVVTVLGDIRTIEVLGDPASGSEMPVVGLPGGGFSLEQREAVQRLQDHLARYLPQASGLLDILRNGASTGFIACGPVPDFLRAYSPSRNDYVLVPELQPLVTKLNSAFATMNRPRGQWLQACSSGSTLLFRDRFVTWRDQAESVLPLLDEVQRGVAELAAK